MNNTTTQEPDFEVKEVHDENGNLHLLIRESVSEKYMDDMFVEINIFDLTIMNNKIVAVKIFQMEIEECDTIEE